MKNPPKQKIKYKYNDIFRYWNSKKIQTVRGKSYEVWYVQNLTSWKTVPCSSESACIKIIANCLAELSDQPSAFKNVSLEQKSGDLIGW